jgi:energy-coupling factor transporter ATP-binding protein EcfA2
MWIKRLQIERFRGIERAVIEFDERQTMLIGPNGAGKSTILEALALLFGRDKLVRTLTEHDFYGSNPGPADRLRLIATITGFSSNVPSDHGKWFSERRGVPKWQDKSGKLLAEPKMDDDALCLQIGFCARFDRSDLGVEAVRYYHDDDSVVDPFDDDVIQHVSTRLLADFGFFLVPAHRTWDRLVSFNSELFRRILESTGALEATEVLTERDRLRGDGYRVDQSGALKELREGVDLQLRKLIPGDPSLELRLTGTDADSLLQALVPHYRYKGSVSLPAGRHGSGLLSLQTALLVLQIATRRQQANQNVIIVVEEPELHMPPGVQAQVLHQLRNACDQLVCTSHSPRVAAVWPARHVRFVNCTGHGAVPVSAVLDGTVPATAKNGIRKLFQECRQDFIEALMHRFVLVPEGRTDVEWLRAFSRCAMTDWDLTAQVIAAPFGTIFGLAPTHDACVVDTVEHIRRVRPGIVVLVDGDPAGDGYVKDLAKMSHAPEFIVQWPRNWVMEDVVGWVLSKDLDAAKRVQEEYPDAPNSVPETVVWLKRETRDKGAKTDFVIHEAITSAILRSKVARTRIRALLDGLVQIVTSGDPSGFAEYDAGRSAANCAVWRVKCEP